MPVRLATIAQGQGLVYSAYGRVTGPDFVAANEEALKLPLGEIVFSVVDHSGASELYYDGNHIKRIVEQDKQLMQLVRPGLLVAVIAPTNLEFGLSRMWQQMAAITGWEILVVRTRDEADRWVRATAARNFSVEVPPFRDELDQAAAQG